jgi:hypothetical protein
VIWTGRLRTGHAVTFRASVFKAFRAAALIEPVAEEDSAVIASVAEDSVAAVIDLVVVGLGALAASAVAVVDSTAGGDVVVKRWLPLVNERREPKFYRDI